MKIIDGRKLGLWFQKPYPGCEPRKEPIDMMVGHWTGGEANRKSAEDDFERVYTNLKNRHDLNGKPMPLSVEFIINAAGEILQCADPLDTVCHHASKVHDRAIGVEIVNPGNGEERELRPRENIITSIRGKKLKQCAFYPAQLEAYLFLCEHVAKTYGVPKNLAPDELLSNAFLKGYRGFVEHYQVSSKKVDAGGQLNAYLSKNGWMMDGEEPKKPKKTSGKT